MKLRCVLVLLVLVVGTGCGSDKSSSQASPVVTTPPLNGTGLYSFENVTLNVSSQWKVVADGQPACVQTIAGPVVVLGMNRASVACPAIARVPGEPIITITSQPTEPVLTTITGMTISNEPFNRHPAQHLHLPTNGTYTSESIYVSDLKITIAVETTPQAHVKASEVLDTIRKA